MRWSILLLIVGACMVSAKYLPDEWDNSGQLLSRYKRSDSDDSDSSNEDNNDSSNSSDDDNDDQPEQNTKEQSKRIINLEKLRQKLLEKQEKEKRKQEEAQHKLEEKIAKELQKEEEKRQKEERKYEEKLEKQRRKLEEEQRKIQEKILENERKRQEKIQKQIEEIEKDTMKMQEGDDNQSGADDSIELEDFWKLHIYAKYGINEANTDVEKRTAVRKYMQEELGLNINSTESERRQAVLRLVETKLQSVSEINILKSQLVDYINYVGVQKIREKLDEDIEKLNNKTEMLNNVNLTWVPVAKQNIAEQVSFLETVKQFLTKILPNWSGDSASTSEPQGLPETNELIKTQIRDSSSLGSNTEASPTNGNDNLSSSSTGDSKSGDVAPNASTVTDNSITPNGSPDSTNYIASASTSSSIDSESPTNLENTSSSTDKTSETISHTSQSAVTNDESSIANTLNSENKQSSVTEVANMPKAATNSTVDLPPVLTSAASESPINEITKNSQNNLNGEGSTTELIKTIKDFTNSINISPDMGTSNDPANTGTTINSKVFNTALNEKADVTPSVSDINNVRVETNTLPSSLPESQNAAAETGSLTNNNQIIDSSDSPNVTNLLSADTTTEYSKNSATEPASTVNPTDGGISSSLPINSNPIDVSLSTVAANDFKPSDNSPDVQNIATEGSKVSEINNDVTTNILTNNSPSTSMGVQTQSVTERVEMTSQNPTLNETSRIANDVQSTPAVPNTEEQSTVNVITTSRTEQSIITDKMLQDISTTRASDLNNGSITEETPINPLVPAEPGASIIDVVKQ